MFYLFVICFLGSEITHVRDEHCKSKPWFFGRRKIPCPTFGFGNFSQFSNEFLFVGLAFEWHSGWWLKTKQKTIELHGYLGLIPVNNSCWNIHSWPTQWWNKYGTWNGFWWQPPGCGIGFEMSYKETRGTQPWLASFTFTSHLAESWDVSRLVKGRTLVNLIFFLVED